MDPVKRFFARLAEEDRQVAAIEAKMKKPRDSKFWGELPQKKKEGDK